MGDSLQFSIFMKYLFRARFSRSTVPFCTLPRILLPEGYLSLSRDGEADAGFFPGCRQAEARAGTGHWHRERCLHQHGPIPGLRRNAQKKGFPSGTDPPGRWRSKPPSLSPFLFNTGFQNSEPPVKEV